MAEQEAWLAGLIDGEGCFTLSIYRQHERALRFDLVFSISMKEGAWFPFVTAVLRKHRIPFSTRRRKNQVEVRVQGHSTVKRLIAIVLPYLVVKRPLASKLLHFPTAPARNRFVAIDESYVRRICETVDFVREFNSGKNRKHKWNSKTIGDFYGIR
ncbi:MAG: LAGLIDADG family homing endonuclease [Nitrososphaerales archaeon]|nr:LAGLIDADG family homing endonuclease [Nitrososphaerales archaeon]